MNMETLDGCVPCQYGWRKVFNSRCPVYNNKAKKLDTVVCPNRKCPPIDYRSNEIHVENYCRYPCNHESSTVMPTIFQNEGNHKLIPYIMGLLILLILFVVLATLAIYVYFRKRKSVQKGDEHELENASPSMGNKNDEFSDEFRQLVDGEIEKTNEVDASRYRGNNNSNMQLLEFNNVTNANSKHQITEPKERQNGIFNKEDQLNGPSMAAKDFSKDDDIVVINCIEEVSNTNNT
uniref:Uncharacterized protein LOC111138158 isoform X2 n=1 Tax=Crassostrea virginica TaxID=6565 RepID=A0A8B8F1M5_CRAVI|nr:uncharacterized protein LOC111138158 isoform X2 [Crassostrea virginica]